MLQEVKKGGTQNPEEVETHTYTSVPTVYTLFLEFCCSLLSFQTSFCVSTPLLYVPLHFGSQSASIIALLSLTLCVTVDKQRQQCHQLANPQR